MAEKRAKRDPEFMRTIGAKGGKNSTFRPFRDIPGLAKKAGKVSGYKQRRTQSNARKLRD